jgi:hypothetical protein
LWFSWTWNFMISNNMFEKYSTKLYTNCAGAPIKIPQSCEQFFQLSFALYFYIITF